MNKTLIVKKLNQMESYLKDLKSLILSRDPEDVKKEPTLLHAAERLVQLLADTIIDINVHILISKDKSYDKTQSTFLLLADLGILSKEFAEKIAPVVGLRNILVHRYEDLDNELFVSNLFKNANDFKRYAVAICDFIKKEKP